MKKKSLLLFGSAAVIFLTACKKDESSPLIPATESSISIKVNFSPITPYTLFSFKNNAIVANTDSISNKWDFALRLTNFLVNSNASGPGTAGVIVQDGIFDNVTTAPATGYAYDTTSNKLAIKDGTWYDYNNTTRTFVPKAGKVFIFRTADNKYSKMEILEATYDPFTGMFPEKINYKIRFVYQSDGSVNLQK
ncbi:MAG: HmuY family protein [Chitinophagaceae bacterium]